VLTNIFQPAHDEDAQDQIEVAPVSRPKRRDVRGGGDERRHHPVDRTRQLPRGGRAMNKLSQKRLVDVLIDAYCHPPTRRRNPCAKRI
jgi:hypothetical protein